MSFRIVVIENEVEISVRLNNLIVKKNGDETWIPLSDISIIIMDNLASTISMRIMCQLANEGIGLIICDQKHHPIGYYGAYDNHSRASKILGYQIEKEESFYNSLWVKIVEKKIQNQADSYYLLKGDDKGSQKIKAFAESIVEGDRTNREAHAAKVYFNLLMGASFSRGNEELILNSGLDYGYAIIRGYLAKLCVGYGLNTQLGIHHKNEYNRFNLVDDIMEPVRPIVDIKAYQLLNAQEYFKPDHRHALVNLLNEKIIYKEKKMHIANMLEEYVAQIAAYYQGKCDEIQFPDVTTYFGGRREDEV